MRLPHSDPRFSCCMADMNHDDFFCADAVKNQVVVKRHIAEFRLAVARIFLWENPQLNALLDDA